MRQLIETSQSDMWNVFSHSPVPDRLILSTSQSGPEFEQDNHHTMAVYKPDVSLSLAWGLLENAEFSEEWHEQGGFPDKKARSIWVDTFWNGVTIDRELAVSVDGGRCTLPLPRRHVEDTATIGWEISRWQHSFFRLINTLGGVSPREYESYVDRGRFFIEQ